MWKEKKRDEESEGFGRYAGRCDCAEFDSGSAFLGSWGRERRGWMEQLEESKRLTEERWEKLMGKEEKLQTEEGAEQ